MFNNRLTVICIIFLCIIFCLPGVLSSQTKHAYDIPWSVLNEGGKTEEATSAFYRFKDAIGQSVIGTCESASYKANIGFWTAPPVQQVIGVVEEKIIMGFDTHETRLFQNYPNPFNQLTVISYRWLDNGKRITENQYVVLRIFDLSGRLVKTFDLTNNESPINQVAWNGTDEQGRRVAPGIYFHRLETEDFKDTRKMILFS